MRLHDLHIRLKSGLKDKPVVSGSYIPSRIVITPDAFMAWIPALSPPSSEKYIILPWLSSTTVLSWSGVPSKRPFRVLWRLYVIRSKSSSKRWLWYLQTKYCKNNQAKTNGHWVRLPFIIDSVYWLQRACFIVPNNFQQPPLLPSLDSKAQYSLEQLPCQ